MNWIAKCYGVMKMTVGSNPTPASTSFQEMNYEFDYESYRINRM